MANTAHDPPSCQRHALLRGSLSQLGLLSLPLATSAGQHGAADVLGQGRQTEPDRAPPRRWGSWSAYEHRSQSVLFSASPDGYMTEGGGNAVWRCLTEKFSQVRR